MTSIAIKGSWVVGWGENGHEVIEDGVVVAEDDRIAFVGSQSDPGCPSADRVIDASGMLVSPGLINLHAIANLDLQVLRMDASNESTFPKPKSFVMDASQPYLLTDEQYQTSADFSVATLLKNGSTTFLNVTSSAAKRWEDSSETYALAEASERMGIRAWIGHFYQEGCNYTDGGGESHIVWDSKKGQQAMDHAIEVVKHLQKKNHPLLTGILFPVRTDGCSDDMLKETVRQAKLLGGVHIRSHFSEYPYEFRGFKAKNPNRTMVEWLNDIGFLGSNVCLTHAIYIAGHSFTGDDAGEDLELLAQSGTSVCHCPVVSARGGKAMESFGRYVRAGVNVGIGTDTHPAGHSGGDADGGNHQQDCGGRSQRGNGDGFLQRGDDRRGEGVGSGGSGTSGAGLHGGHQHLRLLPPDRRADGRPHADVDSRRQRAGLPYGAGGREGCGVGGAGGRGGRGGVGSEGAGGLAEVQGRGWGVGPGRKVRG